MGPRRGAVRLKGDLWKKNSSRPGSYLLVAVFLAVLIGLVLPGVYWVVAAVREEPFYPEWAVGLAVLSVIAAFGLGAAIADRESVSKTDHLAAMPDQGDILKDLSQPHSYRAGNFAVEQAAFAAGGMGVGCLWAIAQFFFGTFYTSLRALFRRRS